MARNPLLKVIVLRLELEVEMLGIPGDGRGAACRADRRAQLLGRVRGAALVAAVAVLSRRAALGASPLHEAVGKEHLALLAIELRRGLAAYVAQLLRREIDTLGKLLVLGRVSRVVVVERDLEIGEVLEMARVRTLDQGLRRYALLAGADHDRRAVRVVGADVDAVVPAHLLEPHPEVGLKILYKVPDVYVTIGIRQRARNHNSTFCSHEGYYSKTEARCLYPRSDLRAGSKRSRRASAMWLNAKTRTNIAAVVKAISHHTPCQRRVRELSIMTPQLGSP